MTKNKKVGRPNELTERQKTFAKYYVEGRYSNAECCRLAGYSESSANVQASKLLDGKSFPKCVDYIKELREARERRYNVTLIGQLKRLEELSIGAEEAGQYSSAINAEKIRSALGGLTIDRRENNHTHQIDKLSRDEIVGRLAELRRSYPHAFADREMKVIKDVKNRETTMELIEETAAEKNILTEN